MPKCFTLSQGRAYEVGWTREDNCFGGFKLSLSSARRDELHSI